jgi:hypothetical protein
MKEHGHHNRGQEARANKTGRQTKRPMLGIMNLAEKRTRKKKKTHALPMI